MGKNLIIKGADFSLNAVENSNLMFRKYLSTDGVAYIDTGYQFVQGDIVETMFLAYTLNSAEVSKNLMGCRKSGATYQTNGNFVVTKNIFQGSYGAAFSIGGNSFFPSFLPGNVERKLIINVGTSVKMYIPSLQSEVDLTSGQDYCNVDFSALVQIQKNVFLFASNINDAATGICSQNDNISQFKVTRGGSVILDLVPCINKGVAGMFNKATNLFIGPANGGSFTAFS